MENLKYPIGQFERPDNITKSHIDGWISDIRSLAERLNAEVKDLSEEQLNWIYRPEGWSIKQVVHHCADSHMNGFIRCKLAVTEDKPTIKPYIEAQWALLPDTLESPIEWSLQLLQSLHARWTVLLENFDESQLKRSFMHPEYGTEYTVEEAIGNYAWHSNHHLAHVVQAKDHQGQFN